LAFFTKFTVKFYIVFNQFIQEIEQPSVTLKPIWKMKPN
jgi:hypothetical protein